MLAGKPERKRPLGRPIRRWEDNIKTDIGETRFRMWIELIFLGIRTVRKRL
jgi:hypothetical protein